MIKIQKDFYFEKRTAKSKAIVAVFTANKDEHKILTPTTKSKAIFTVLTAKK